MSMSLAIHALLALLLLRGAWHKFAHAQTFRAQLAAYRLLPAPLVGPAAFALGVADIAGACFLPAAAALLGLYSAAIGINLLRGHTDIDCGCGGWGAVRDRLDGWLLARNLLLVGLALLAWALQPSGAHPGVADIALAAVAGLALFLLYLAGEQAIANRQRQQQWRERRATPIFAPVEPR